MLCLCSGWNRCLVVRLERRDIFDGYPAQRFLNCELTHRLHLHSIADTETVDWIVENIKIDRAKAIKVCQKLIDKKIIHHVTDDHDFKDEPLFYRFYADEEKSIWTDEL